MSYLKGLQSAELDLCSYKEELLRLRSEHLASPQPFSQCDSGYSDSHSSVNDRLSLSPIRRWEQCPTDPESLGMTSAPQPPPRDRANSYLTSQHSETDFDDIDSLSSKRCSALFPSQPHMYDHSSRLGAGTFQECSPSLLHYQRCDNSWSAAASLPKITVACHTQSNARLVSPAPEEISQSPRLKVLEFIAKDIEHFDPDNCDHHIENYFVELDHNLIDLPHATQTEKVKLLWKTSSKAVHKFI